MTNNTTRQNCNKTHLCKKATGNSRYAKYIKGTLYACLSAGIREIPTEFSRKRTPRHSGVVCLPRQKLSCFLNSLPPPRPNECVGESSSGIVSSYMNPGFCPTKIHWISGSKYQPGSSVLSIHCQILKRSIVASSK